MNRREVLTALAGVLAVDPSLKATVIEKEPEPLLLAIRCLESMSLELRESIAAAWAGYWQQRGQEPPYPLLILGDGMDIEAVVDLRHKRQS